MLAIFYYGPWALLAMSEKHPITKDTSWLLKLHILSVLRFSDCKPSVSGSTTVCCGCYYSRLLISGLYSIRDAREETVRKVKVER